MYHEYINKWEVVGMLTELENQFQHYKPFSDTEKAMYRKLCEVEIAIGKKKSELLTCKDCRYYRAKNFPLFSGDCFYGVSGERTVFEDHYCGYGERKMDKEE